MTVIFADVANFTSMGERFDPEDVHHVMDGCFEILTEEIHRYEGTVNQYRGDGIMAIFGAPVAHEDHTKRACNAALDIQVKLKAYEAALERKFGMTFKMRIGINTGPVVVGSIGGDLRMDYTAWGDTTNLASRMESMAEPGSIMVSRDIFKRVRQYFEFRYLGRVTVKGKGDLLDVYKLRGRLSESPMDTDRKIYSELVGRDADLKILELSVQKLINGNGSIVNLVGDAGIGKSRLIAELKKKEEIKKVRLLEGRALAIGKNLSFHPIIDILKSWAGIREKDPEPKSIEKLERAVRSIYPRATDEIIPFIATLMGLKISGRHAERLKGIEGEALETLILKNIRGLMVKAAEIAPIVYIIEDLHWSDLTTIQFLETLFRLAEEHRILFINVLRPNYRETGDRLLDTIRQKYSRFNTDIYLEPLSREECDILIKNLTKTWVLSHDTRQQIIKCSEGNPFFIEEVVRSFIDEGVVELEDGTFRATRRIESVTIPATMKDVITARIDKLDEDTKDLLKVASVIGRHFFYRILSHVAGQREDIEEKLDYLKKVQLIRERKKMGEIEYLFKHGLTQEAAYESILLNRRKGLHLKVARAIESVFSRKLHNFYGILAYHYSNGENMDKAEEYLLKSGEEALRSSASIEALNYYQEGLKLYLKKYGNAADRKKITAFEKNIALAFFNRGQHEKAIQHFDNVFELWGEGAPKTGFIRHCRFINDFFRVLGALYLTSGKAKKTPTQRDSEIINFGYKRAQALVHLDPRRCFVEFSNILKRLTSLDIARVENGVGIWMSASGLFSWSGISFRLSRKILEYCKNIVRQDDVRQKLYYDLFELMHNCLEGHWSDVKDYDEQLLTANLELGESWHVQNYLLFHGLIRIDRGCFQEAGEIIEKLTDIWNAYGNENAIAVQHFLKLRLYVASGELDKALEVVNEACGQDESDRPSAMYYLGYRAIIQISKKDLSGAEATLLRSEELFSERGRVPAIFISAYLTAQILFDLQLLEQAIDSGEASVISRCRKRALKSGQKALKNSKKYAFNRAGALRLMGACLWLTGRQKRALKSLRRSVKEAERLEARVDLAQTYREIGRRLSEKGSRFLELNGTESDEYFKMSRILNKKMSPGGDTEQTDRIMTCG